MHACPLDEVWRVVAVSALLPNMPGYRTYSAYSTEECGPFPRNWSNRYRPTDHRKPTRVSEQRSGACPTARAPPEFLASTYCPAPARCLTRQPAASCRSESRRLAQRAIDPGGGHGPEDSRDAAARRPGPAAGANSGPRALLEQTQTG